MKIAVIFPSRGLVFSRTAEELLENLKGYNHKIFFSHRKPIPECFEFPTTNALADKEVTHLWFVEDDMILPPTILKDMLDLDLAVVTVNYPTTNKGNAAILSIKGQVIYGGTGCLLVKREVFNELPKPYFRTDIMWKPKNLGESIKFMARKRDKVGYGYHDVNFFMNLYKLEIPVHKLHYTIGQRKLVALGKAGSNNGAHLIEEWHEVEEDRFFSLIDNLPVQESGELIEIVTSSGTVLAKPDHAQRLIDAGKATKPPKKAVIIEDLL